MNLGSKYLIRHGKLLNLAAQFQSQRIVYLISQVRLNLTIWPILNGIIVIIVGYNKRHILACFLRVACFDALNRVHGGHGCQCCLTLDYVQMSVNISLGLCIWPRISKIPPNCYTSYQTNQ